MLLLQIFLKIHGIPTHSEVILLIGENSTPLGLHPLPYNPLNLLIILLVIDQLASDDHIDLPHLALLFKRLHLQPVPCQESALLFERKTGGIYVDVRDCDIVYYWFVEVLEDYELGTFEQGEDAKQAVAAAQVNNHLVEEVEVCEEV